MNDDEMQRLLTESQAVDAQMAELKARHAMEKETWTKEVHASEARINEEVLSFQDQRQAPIVRAHEQHPSCRALGTTSRNCTADGINTPLRREIAL